MAEDECILASFHSSVVKSSNPHDSERNPDRADGENWRPNPKAIPPPCHGIPKGRPET